VASHVAGEPWPSSRSGWAIDRLGFFAALGALTLLGSLAGREFRLKEALVLV